MTDAPEQNPYATPIMPVKLSLDDTIQFNCHKGIACFNKCCQQIDLTLAPYDIVRLKNRLGLSTREFLAQYTVPFSMDGQEMPGIKMRTKDESTVCPLLTEEGCSVYEDRPTASVTTHSARWRCARWAHRPTKKCTSSSKRITASATTSPAC